MLAAPCAPPATRRLFLCPYPVPRFLASLPAADTSRPTYGTCALGYIITYIDRSGPACSRTRVSSCAGRCCREEAEWTRPCVSVSQVPGSTRHRLVYTRYLFRIHPRMYLPRFKFACQSGRGLVPRTDPSLPSYPARTHADDQESLADETNRLPLVPRGLKPKPSPTDGPDETEQFGSLRPGLPCPALYSASYRPMARPWPASGRPAPALRAPGSR